MSKEYTTHAPEQGQPFGINFVERMDETTLRVDNATYDERFDCTMVRRDGQYIPFAESATPYLHTLTATKAREASEEDEERWVCAASTMTETKAREAPDEDHEERTW